MTSSNDLIVKTALNTINIESQTIAELTESVDDNFIETVKIIHNCKGRVVVTGIGKSAIIGKKIVATFNSTGTPAIFMHAADAIHGDLGMIQENDVVICLSKSGETAEVKVLIPMLKRLGSHLIAISSHKNSYLAQHAHFLLYVPIAQEADPNNLAPTASTAAQMTMGDALAMALLALKGFSASDFAKFHPGGSLGKRLYLCVHHICNKEACPKVEENASIRKTIIEMTSKRLGCTAVVDAQNKVLGIITDGDLRRMLEQKKDVAHLCAKDIMTKSPKSIQQSELAVNALELMSNYSITQLIVLDKENYVGIIHLHDLIKEGIV